MFSIAIDATNISAGGAIKRIYHEVDSFSSQEYISQIHLFISPQAQQYFLETGEINHPKVSIYVPKHMNRWKRDSSSSLESLINIASTFAWRNVSLVQIMKKMGVDVLYSPTAMLPMIKNKQIKFVCSPSSILPLIDLPEQGYELTLKSAITFVPKYIVRRRAVLRSLAHSDGIIFLSNSTKSIVERRHHIAIKHHVVSPNAPDRVFYSNTKTDWALHDPIRLLCVSHITEYKRQDSLVKALKGLKERTQRRITVDFVGYTIASYRSTFERIVSNEGVREDIRLLGNRPYSELPDIFKNADIFVFTSTIENCPFTLLEAMATGSVIACSDRDFNREFAKDAAVYFDVDDIGSVVEAIARLIDSQDLRSELSLRAHQLAEGFDWESSGRSKSQLLKTVVES